MPDQPQKLKSCWREIGETEIIRTIAGRCQPWKVIAFNKRAIQRLASPIRKDNGS
jgi:hypothetical protein